LILLETKSLFAKEKRRESFGKEMKKHGKKIEDFGREDL
jgi:hypothetical protein